TGASRGIGAATAIELARRGYSLVLTARSLDGLNATARAANERGAETLVVPADIREYQAVIQLSAKAIDRFGYGDHHINTAGRTRPGGGPARRQRQPYLGWFHPQRPHGVHPWHSLSFSRARRPSDRRCHPTP